MAVWRCSIGLAKCGALGDNLMQAHGGTKLVAELRKSNLRWKGQSATLGATPGNRGVYSYAGSSIYLTVKVWNATHFVASGIKCHPGMKCHPEALNSILSFITVILPILIPSIKCYLGLFSISHSIISRLTFSKASIISTSDVGRKDRLLMKRLTEWQ